MLQDSGRGRRPPPMTDWEAGQILIDCNDHLHEKCRELVSNGYPELADKLELSLVGDTHIVSAKTIHGVLVEKPFENFDRFTSFYDPGKAKAGECGQCGSTDPAGFCSLCIGQMPGQDQSLPNWAAEEIRAAWRAAGAAGGQTEAYRILERMVDRLGYGRRENNPPLTGI